MCFGECVRVCVWVGESERERNRERGSLESEWKVLFCMNLPQSVLIQAAAATAASGRISTLKTSHNVSHFLRFLHLLHFSISAVLSSSVFLAPIFFETIFISGDFFSFIWKIFSLTIARKSWDHFYVAILKKFIFKLLASRGLEPRSYVASDYFSHSHFDHSRSTKKAKVGSQKSGRVLPTLRQSLLRPHKAQLVVFNLLGCDFSLSIAF